MSASKKKRLGSQRRPLNPNVQDSPETSDKALSPPVPQGRQRADANADLPLSPSSAQSETSARKKKLGSQRSNKGKLQFKDVTAESSHKPIEEIKGSTTQSQALEALGITHESIDESLEGNVKVKSSASEAAGLLLSDASDSGLSTITEAMSQKSEIHDTNMDTTSDVLLKVSPSEKYLNTEIVSTEEGVLSVNDQAQQMPDIFEATIPAGVTGESPCSVRLIEQEENMSSHDHNNKHNTGDKAGPIEKPVSQDRDSSYMSSAISTKEDSSRREKLISVKELQEQGKEIAAQSNISNVLETTGFTTVDNSLEVSGVTYKEGGQVKTNLSLKPSEEKIDEDYTCDVAGANLSKVKSEDPHTVLVEMKVEDDASFDYFATVEENKEKSKEVKAETFSSNLLSELLSEVESDKSLVTELKFTKDETVPEFNIEKQEQLISFSDEASIVPDQVYKKEHQNDVNLSDEQLLQREDPLDFSLQIPESEENAQYSTADVSLNDVKEAKTIETEISSSHPVYDESVQHHDETVKDHTKEESTTVAVVQEPILENESSMKGNTNVEEQDQDSDKSVTTDMSESSSESMSVKPSIEGLLFVDQNKDNLNTATTTDSIGSNNEADIAQTKDLHHITTFVRDTLEDLLSQQSEPLITLTNEASPDSSESYKEEYTEEIKPSHEQIDDLQTDISSEPKKTLNPHTEEINAHLTSSIPDIAASVDDVSGTGQVHNKKIEEITTPEIVIEDILEVYRTDMSMDNKDHSAGPDEMDKGPIPVHDESTDNEDLKYTSKPTDESGIEESHDMSDTQQSTEQLVNNETTGEPFETVQNLEVEVNAPDTDPRHGPVRRKFGSSRRSKAKTDFTKVIAVDNKDALSIESKDLPSSVNLQTDDQSEPVKKDKNMKVDNAVDAELLSPILQSPETENQAAQGNLDESSIHVNVEALETEEDYITNDEVLKLTEVTALFEAEQTAEEIISNVTDNQVSDNLNLEQTTVDFPYIQKTSTEPKNNTEHSDVSTIGFAVKDTINVHQLTYISDSETNEEIDNTSLQKSNEPVLEETVEEPSQSVKLVHTPNSDAHHSQRRKLGSSRRVKERKLEVIPTDSKLNWSNDNEDVSQATELVEACPAEAQELQEDTNTLVLSDIDQTVDSTQEQMIKTPFVSLEEKIIKDIQKETPEEVSDSFTIKDLKDKSIVEREGLSPDVDVNNKDSQIVAESEEKVSVKTDDAMQSFVMSAEDMTKEQDRGQGMDILITSAELKKNYEPENLKIGSTQRSQLNRKPQDIERNAEDNTNILVKDTMDEIENSLTVSEKKAQPHSRDIFVNPGDTTIAVDQHQSKEITERKEVTQEDKEKILQTEADLVEEIDKGVTVQTLQPIDGEEIHPSSPGKRRKMGSTRKNLLSKRESPQEETVTSANLEGGVGVSISNDNNESKEHSGLLVYTATVHQPPPDEETPLSQQINQERLRSESKEAELSSQQEVMSVDAATARRRKMGSHRKPHSDQSITQRRVTDSEKSLLNPLGEHRAESPKLTKLSEVNEGDSKVPSSATAFNIKVDSRPVSENIAKHPPQPSTNVRQVQESNIRISSGFDRSAIRYEVVMIGDSSVGKTTFIQRAQSGKFSPDVPASIGMDSYKWTVIVNGKTIVLHLWDTAGQERFRSMTKQIFHRAQAFLLMYDVTCAQTFTAVSYWANCIKDGAADNAVVLLLGNKSDRVERKVTREEGEILAEENSFAFMECSAATGENVIEALETVARLLSQKVDRTEEPLLLRRPEPKNKSCC